MTPRPFLLACMAALAAAAQAGEAPEARLKLDADIVAFEQPEIFYAIGHVRLQRGDAMLSADGAVVWTREREAYLEGHVVYRMGKSVFECDRAYVHWTTAEDPATGKSSTVVDRGFLIEPNVRWAERADQIPWHVRAEEVLQTDPRRFLGRGHVILSPCGFDVPHAYFRASEVEFLRDERIIVKNVSYNVQGVSLPTSLQGVWVPPFYWPKLYVPLGYKWPEVDVEFGHSDRFGTYVRSEVRYPLPEGSVPLVDSKVGVDLDYFSKRGVAYGGLFQYEYRDLLRGELRYYRLPHDDGKDRGEYELGTTDRYRWNFFHSQDMPEGWEFDAEYQKWSDAGFRQEYFLDEYLESKPIESRAYLKWSDGPLAGYLHLRWREDDWLDTTEYLPQVGFDVFSYPLVGNLVYTGNVELAYVRRRLSNLRLDPGQARNDPEAVETRFEEDFYHRPLRSTTQEFLSDDERFWRFSTYHELAAPFDAGIFNVDPFVGVRGNYYSKTLDGGGDWRALLVGGARVSTEFWKGWDDVHSDGLRLFGHKLLPLQVDGLRHVVTPELRVLAVEDAGLHYRDLILTDDEETNQPASDPGFDGFRLVSPRSRLPAERPRVYTIDPLLAVPVSRPRLYYGYDTTGLAFGDVNDVYPFRVVNFGLRNRWQTRRGGRVVDFVDVDANVDLFLDDQTVNNGETWGDARVDIRFRPIDGVSFFADFGYNVGGNDYLRRDGSRDVYDTHDPTIPVFNTGLAIYTSEQWQLYLSQRYEADESSLYGIRFVYLPSEKWRFDVQYEYDAEAEGRIETTVRIARDLHDWIADFVVSDDRETGDKVVGFRLRPKLRRELVTGLYYTRELGATYRAEGAETYQSYDY